MSKKPAPPVFRDTDPERDFPRWPDRVLLAISWMVAGLCGLVVAGLLMVAVGLIHLL